MNRSELVKAVAERAGSDDVVARRHVDAVVETVMERVSAGERVTVTGFGTFDRLSRPARSARNPRTGVPVAVAAAEVPRFRSGRTFRTRVAGEALAVAEESAVAPAPPETAVAGSADPKAAENGKGGKGGKGANKAKKGADPKKGTGPKKASKKKPEPIPASAKNGKNGKKSGKKSKKAKAKAAK